MNKRTKLDDLSSQVNELNEQTTQLQQENFTLKQENFRLQNEVIYLKNYITQSTGMNKPIKQETSTSSSSLNSHSIFLFVVLLSFGLLWNFDITNFNLFASSKSSYSKIIEDPLLNELDINLHNEIPSADNRAPNQFEDSSNHNRPFKKDVEICC